jgi:hypothetical protein
VYVKIKEMTSVVEQRKLVVIDHLSELEDEHILQQIENLLLPTPDFWDELNDYEKGKIERSLSQAENGELVDFEHFINNLVK